jgi:hypothetical protein
MTVYTSHFAVYTSQFYVPRKYKKISEIRKYFYLLSFHFSLSMYLFPVVGETTFFLTWFYHFAYCTFNLEFLLIIL